MKKKSKRYYGMTMSQIQILVGVGVGGLLISCILIAFLLMPTSTPAAPQQQAPAATQAVATASNPPAPTTVAETDTPTPPAVAATNIPPVGWVDFTTPQGVTIWLPGTFIGGDMGADRENTMAKVAKLGRYYRNVVNSMKNAGDNTVMWMIDKKVELNDVITNVIVSRDAGSGDLTLDEYIKNTLNADSNGTPTSMLITVNQTKKITLLGHDARRLTISQMYAGHEAVGLIYYIKDAGNIWSIMYVFSTNQYVDMFANAEKSVETFYIGE